MKFIKVSKEHFYNFYFKLNGRDVFAELLKLLI